MPHGMRAPRPASRPEGGSTHRLTELIQRGRMTLEVAQVDLQMVQSRQGPFHETTWYFRQALADATQSWDRLCQEVGERGVATALAQPPSIILELNHPGRPGTPVCLILIQGGTYRLEPVPGTPLAPSIWRLTRLATDQDPEPYYALKRADGSTQCDCAEWVYRIAETNQPRPCKHLAALHALGRL